MSAAPAMEMALPGLCGSRARMARRAEGMKVPDPRPTSMRATMNSHSELPNQNQIMPAAAVARPNHRSLRVCPRSAWRESPS